MTNTEQVAAIIAEEQEYRGRQWLRLLSITDASPPAPTHGADPAKVDWDHVITGDQRPGNGQRYENCVIDGRFLKYGLDVHLSNVVIKGGSKLPTAPRAVAEFAAGAVLEGVTVEPHTRSVMWSEGVRVNGPAYSRGLKIAGTVDGLGVVTPSGTRTDNTHVDLHVTDLAWFPNDPNHGAEGTHNDGLQLHGPVDGFRLVRPVLHPGSKATACVMVNVPYVNDFTIIDGDLAQARCGVNFGPTPKGLRVAVVDTTFACLTDVFATDGLALNLRLTRSVRASGSPATRTKS